MSNPPKLRQLERRETDLILRWKDDSEHVVTYAEMRYWCPVQTANLVVKTKLVPKRFVMKLTD